MALSLIFLTAGIAALIVCAAVVCPLALLPLSAMFLAAGLLVDWEKLNGKPSATPHNRG